MFFIFRYDAIEKLVVNSVGVSQAVDTSMAKSSQSLLILTPIILKVIIHIGFTDHIKQVSIIIIQFSSGECAIAPITSLYVCSTEK